MTFFFLIFLQSSDLVFLGFLDPGNLLPPDPYLQHKGSSGMGWGWGACG